MKIELAKEVHENAKSKGFHEGEKNIGEMLCLIHSEVSEALEADRKGNYCEVDNENWILDGKGLREDIDNEKDLITKKLMFEKNVKDTFEDELADIMIRVMDLAHFKGIDLEWHIKQKMNYNSKREHKHGKKY